MTKNKKEKLKIVGLTQDNKTVVNGSKIFKIMESVGLPLDIILYELKNNDLIVDWIDFYETALKSNWTIKTLFDRLEPALSDVYDKDMSEGILKRLKYYIMEQNK
jgi:alanyl-tRNA synthetase